MGIKERRGREEQARLLAILGAAESVFASKGYYETRMDDIAHKAELAKGTIYYYFKSKEEIYLHLLESESDKVFQSISARIKDKVKFLDILKEVIDFSVEYFESNLTFLKIFLPCMCGLVQFGDAGLLRRGTQSLDRHGELIRDSLQKALDTERLPFSLDAMLQFLKTLQLGLFLRLLEGNPRDARETADFFIDIISKTMEKHA
jgi:AcrR family transcriptional regulator